MWTDSTSLVFVHTNEQLEAHEIGISYLEPVGFPIEDVYVRHSSGELQPYADHKKGPSGE